MNIRQYLTFGDSKLFREETEGEFLPDDGTENEVINLYPHMRYQTMEGFGGAFTDAAGFVFSKMSNEQQDELLRMYFSPEQMNYRMVRIPIDSCDFSTHMYTADDDKEDTEFLNFSFQDVEAYLLPLLDRAEAYCKRKLPIMLSPWSPPAYMKTNHNRKEGGNLKKEYYSLWARYLCRYIKEYTDRGYHIQRLSIQNEPKAVQPWDSCVYSAGDEQTFIRDFLVPEMKKNNLSHIELFIWDHNKERAFERACDVMSDQTKELVAGVAFHWYSGDHFDALSLILEKFPDKKLILSESCLEFSRFGKDDQTVNAGRLAHDMIGNLNHGMSGFYDWNILLDEKGGPNHTGNYCDAPFLYHGETKKLEERFVLRYYWHFTHFIQPGAVRIAATCYTSFLDVTAWENPDHSIAVIILNRSSSDLPYVLRISGRLVKFTAKASSIITAVIKE
ncbi:glycosyl hydrolase [Lacrimispora amygdalina]|uniref:Glycosyl hydrolase n=1 Tax=Lacrimispora amygdalina TaxID=253257 RepID=A0ABQ5LZT5_9FIRM